MAAPRRRVLRALAASGIVSIAGCASVVNQTSDADPSDGDGTTQEPATPRSGDENVSGANDDASTTEEPETPEWTVDEVSIDPPSETFSSVSIPSEASDYPRMGPDDAPTVTLLGNWKCPYTRDFVFDQLPALVEEYVDPGDLSVEFRSLAFLDGNPFLGPDAPDSTRAGLAVWESDPDAFWEYLSYVFANQPPERREWGQPELLVRFAEAADVNDPGRIESAIAEEAFDDRLQLTTTFASSLGVGTVPRVVSDDEVTAPTVSPDETRAQLDKAIDQ